MHEGSGDVVLEWPLNKNEKSPGLVYDVCK